MGKIWPHSHWPQTSAPPPIRCLECQLRFASSQHHRFLAVRRDLGEHHREAGSWEKQQQSSVWMPVALCARAAAATPQSASSLQRDPLCAGAVPRNLHTFPVFNFLLLWKAEIIYSTLIFTEEETEAQNSSVTSPGSHCYWVGARVQSQACLAAEPAFHH